MLLFWYSDCPRFGPWEPLQAVFCVFVTSPLSEHRCTHASCSRLTPHFLPQPWRRSLLWGAVLLWRGYWHLHSAVQIQTMSTESELLSGPSSQSIMFCPCGDDWLARNRKSVSSFVQSIRNTDNRVLEKLKVLSKEGAESNYNQLWKWIALTSGSNISRAVLWIRFNLLSSLLQEEAETNDSTCLKVVIRSKYKVVFYPRKICSLSIS